VSFVDLSGTLRSKLVPIGNIRSVAREGAGFAGTERFGVIQTQLGFATHFDLGPDRADLFSIADPSSLIQLPWNKEIGWLAGDLYIDGKPLDQGPRNVLRRQMEKAKALGYTFKTGVECEFFLLKPDCHEISDKLDTNTKPCYEQQALYRKYDLLKEVRFKINVTR
jgi:glutamine synthetase